MANNEIMYTTIIKGAYTVIQHTKAQAEIDLTNINELSAALNELIDAGTENIIINFKNVIYIDSSALGTLLEAMKKLKKQNKELGILSISRDILNIFLATQIAQYFKFYKTL